MSAGRRRGPARAPVELQILRGNPSKTKINRVRPRSRPGARWAPKWMDHAAKTEWRRVVPELRRLGMFTVLDRSTIITYCQAWSTYMRAMKEIHNRGFEYTLTTDSGYPMKNPWLAIADRAFEQLRSLAGEFGLTPSARGRLFAPSEEPKDDPMEDFLRRKRHE